VKSSCLIFIDDDVPVPLPGCTSLTEEGVLFTYVPYEIASYAAGTITFIIPYKSISPYLTEEVRRLVGLEAE